MANYYFDIETTGLKPGRDKLITIQYQELDRATGKAIGELVILKEWESSEREILRKFIKDSGIGSESEWAFVPTGYNLGFEHNFLRERTARHSLNPLDILSKPFIDLRAFGIIMNRGEFRGSGLDKITGKQSDGKNVPTWYLNKEYSRIIRYVTNEAEEFIKFNAWLYKEMPAALEKFRVKNGLG